MMMMMMMMLPAIISGFTFLIKSRLVVISILFNFINFSSSFKPRKHDDNIADNDNSNDSNESSDSDDDDLTRCKISANGMTNRSIQNIIQAISKTSSFIRIQIISFTRR